jgi:hypothetical protein
MGGNNQKWTMVDQVLKTEENSNCLDYNYNDDNLYMNSDCHTGNNQKWYWDPNLKATPFSTKQDDKCMTYDTSDADGNVKMSACIEGAKTQNFFIVLDMRFGMP